MANKFDFFEIFENYEPDEKILTDKASKNDKDRIIFLVLKKKGENEMKLKKYSAAAAIAVMVLLAGTMGVDAASGGTVRKAVSESGEAIVEKVTEVLHIKTTDNNGNVKEEDVNVEEDENGNITYTIPALDEGESVKITDDAGGEFIFYDNTKGAEVELTDTYTTEDGKVTEKKITINVKD